MVDRSERPYSPDHLSELSYDEVRALLAAEGFEIAARHRPAPRAAAQLALAAAQARPPAAPLEPALGGAPDARCCSPRAPSRPRYALDLIFVARGGVSGRGSAWAAAGRARWVLLCVRWFDPAAPLAPRVRWRGYPPSLLALPLLAAWACGCGGRAAAREARAARRPGPLAGAGRHAPLPAAPGRQGGAGYVTADGALSGLMALHVRDGASHRSSCRTCRTAAA